MLCKILPGFILLPFFSMIAGAQVYNRDSVIQLVNNIRETKVDTGHVRKLWDVGYVIGEKDSALAKQLLEEAVAKSKAINDAASISNSYRMLGLWHKAVNDKDKAMMYYRASLQKAKENNILYLTAGAYFEMATIKYEIGEYDSCIDFYLKTQEIFENPKVFEYKILTQRILDKKKSDLYSNISAVFSTLGNLPKADEYINKALAIAESYVAQSSKAKNIIALYMQQKAGNYYDNREFERALRIRLQYLPQLENGVVPRVYVLSSYQSIAEEFYELKKIDSSKLFAQKSMQLAKQLEVPDVVARVNMLLGRIAIQEKKFKMAQEYLKQCSSYYENNKDPHQKRSYLAAMQELMFATSKYKEAYLYAEQYHTINDSVLNSERSRQFAEREAKYESEKKNVQIQLQQSALKQKSRLNLFLAGAIAALLCISLLIYFNYKQKQKLQQQRITELETEKQLTATEAVLKGEEQERTRLAKDLHDGLGGMLSGIKYSFQTMKGNLIMTPDNAQTFERSMDMLDSSIKEMRRVAHNMMPEALVKFGLNTALKDFCNDINLSGALKVTYQSIGLENVEVEQTTAIAIYRIVQELLNNTIKHAGANNAIVQVSKSDGLLAVTVEDDGKGFDTSILKQAKGIGWSNIENRVEFLKGKLDVNSQPGKGTSVLIELNT
ncbi:MAG: sensor histidine kinase [Ferruginibacter sp.]